MQATRSDIYSPDARAGEAPDGRPVVGTSRSALERVPARALVDPGVATFFGVASVALLARASLSEGELELRPLLNLEVGSSLALFAMWSVIVAATLAVLWARGWRRGRFEEATTAALQRLTARLLAVQETERRRIARDLHDALGHTLVLAKLRLAGVAAEHPGGEALLAELGAVLDQAAGETRRIAHELRPATLESLGLSAALRMLPEQDRSRGGPRVSASVDDVDDSLPAAAHVVVYRIVQEALTNARKYAAGANVSVRVRSHPGSLEAVVEDDGPGFDATAVRHADAGGGWGLVTMQERARMLGGRLQITSKLGRGTRVHLELPCAGNGRCV